jgi:hypothetical protein
VKILSSCRHGGDSPRSVRAEPALPCARMKAAGRGAHLPASGAIPRRGDPPARKTPGAREIPSPRWRVPTFPENLVPPAGRRQFARKKLNPHGGTACRREKSRSPLADEHSRCRNVYSPWGFSFFSSNRAFPHGGRRFFSAEATPRRGFSFLNVNLPFPRGGRRFFDADGDRPAGV